MNTQRIPTYNQALNDAGNNTSLLTVTNTSREEYAIYLRTLEALGFVKYCDTREAAGNIFNTYVRGDNYIYTYFLGAYQTAKVASGHVKYLPKAPDYIYHSTSEYTPSMTLVGQIPEWNCGAGIIYLLPDGRFIIHDGGNSFESRPDAIYNAICEIAPYADEITVAAIFITHPHADHQDAAVEFIKNHYSDVTIESVVYNYAPAQYYDFKRDDGETETGSEYVIALTEALKLLDKTNIIKAHTGQLLDYGCATAEILYTVEDFFPNRINYINTSSTVVRLNIAGQSHLLLADTTHEGGKIMEDIWKDYLESDAVQLAHHGMWASNVSLYERANAKNIIWSNNYREAKRWYTDAPVAAAIAVADNIYVAGSGNLTVELPAEESNKDEVMAMIEACEE